MLEIIKSKTLNALRRHRNIFGLLKKNIRTINIPEYVSFSIFALIIGGAAGVSAVIFHHSIDYLNQFFFNQTREGFFFLGSAAVILIPAVGMFIQGLMIKFFKNYSDKKGVWEVIKAVSTRGGIIPFRITIFNFFASVICIGSGGTLGPEGPAAQLGGGVASKIGGTLNLADEKRRIFTAAGAGAAIAAIFNTPLGGVFFAIEVILLNDFHTPTFSALIIASVAASAISRILLGNASVFQFDVLQNFDYSTIYVYAVIGIVTGIISILFINYSDRVKKLFKEKIFPKNYLPQWGIMVIVGILLGVCGMFYKEIFGIGYSGINSILKNEIAVTSAFVLLIMKFFLVPIVFHSGGFGGFFAPSLFMGASTGFLIQYLFATVLNLQIADDTVILVSMGAMLGGMNSIPIAAILIILEMTQNYNFILPLMLAVILCSMLVQISLRKSIHVKHLEAEGFSINSHNVNILKKHKIEDVKLRPIFTINEDVLLPEIIAIFSDNAEENCIYVKNNSGQLIGYISENELRPIIAEFENVKLFLVARDLVNPNIYFFSPADSLDFAMNVFSKNSFNVAPVKVSSDVGQLIGFISKDDIIKFYSRESLKENFVDGFNKELKTINKSTSAKVSKEHSIIEMDIPNTFIGKTLQELQLRSRFGIEVLMLKSKEGISDPKIKIPDPTRALEKGDLIIIFGRDEDLQKIKNI